MPASLGSEVSNVVVLHGYEIGPNYELGPLSLAVCETALPLLKQDEGQLAILLGGWHTHEPGPYVTIADAMYFWLIARGANGMKLFMRRTAGCDRFMEARDTWEEVISLHYILRKLGFMSPERTLIKCVAWSFHMKRVLNIYKAFGFTNVQPIPAYASKRLPRRTIVELFARAVQRFDPYGISKVCEAIRAKRTLDYRGMPLIRCAHIFAQH